MNTRLQVEHTVTEMVTGLDLVALQLAVAHGRAASTTLDPQPRGAAIQCRINAEDPGRNFLPGPGRITRYREPGGPFVRVDSGVARGSEVPGDYDSMFAKLIVFGEDREQARRRMLRALDEFDVEGVPTTIPVHRWILESKAFRDRRRTRRRGSSARSSTRTCPRRCDLQPAPGGPEAGAARRHPRRGGRAPRAGPHLRRAPRPGARRPRPRTTRTTASHVHGEIQAPMQGTILKVLVEKGQAIEAGDVVCILEAMKMENHIASTREGEVTELPIRAGQVVETGQTLAVID